MYFLEWMAFSLLKYTFLAFKIKASGPAEKSKGLAQGKAAKE